MESRVLFTERQYYRQFLVIGLAALTNLFFLYGSIQQLIFKQPFGTKSAPDAVLFLSLLGSLVLTYLIATTHLDTTISTQGVGYQFYPFQLRPIFIPWQAVKSCYIRTYSPLAEYGGWGYRNYPNNSAFNVSGNTGIQLVLHTRKFILIGTNKVQQAQQAINSIALVNE